jgi:3-oxoadipate enol-lactonase
MAKAPINGLQLYYDRRGAGPKLLFANGSGGDLRRPPVIFDSPLGTHFDLLGYDHRGLGQSSLPDGRFEMADLADDAARLLDHVGWERCHVFGVSFGGMVAQELALRHPDRIDKLVAGCAPAGGAGGSSHPLHTLNDLTPVERAKYLIPVLDTRKDENWQNQHTEEYTGLVEEMARALSNPDGAPGVTKGLQLQLDARSRHDTWDRLDQLKMPVYICGGQYDASATPSSLEKMAGQIPQAKLEFFNGGHRFWLDDTTAFRKIIAFLKE